MLAIAGTNRLYSRKATRMAHRKIVERVGSGVAATVVISANGRMLSLRIDNATLVFGLMLEGRTHNFGSVGYDAAMYTIFGAGRAVSFTSDQLEEIMAILKDPVQYHQLTHGDAPPEPPDTDPSE